MKFLNKGYKFVRTFEAVIDDVFSNFKNYTEDSFKKTYLRSETNLIFQNLKKKFWFNDGKMI